MTIVAMPWRAARPLPRRPSRIRCGVSQHSSGECFMKLTQRTLLISLAGCASLGLASAAVAQQ
uniref:hypothetical protein n=1 Tax=Sphingomonas bacterium TaxID=1895847 RepID=UPI002623CD49